MGAVLSWYSRWLEAKTTVSGDFGYVIEFLKGLAYIVMQAYPFYCD